MDKINAYHPETVSSHAYERAEARLAPNIHRLVPRIHGRPIWLDGGRRFCFERRTLRGGRFIIIDCESGEEAAAFNHAQIADVIAAISGEAVDSENLGLTDLRFSTELQLQHFVHGGQRYSRSEAGDWQGTPVGLPPAEVVSPDGAWCLTREGDDLALRTRLATDPRRLTTDGTPDHSYGKSPDANNSVVSLRRLNFPHPPLAIWSPDSKKILTHRLDERGVEFLHLVESAPRSGVRPVLHSYRVPFPGDPEVAKSELVIFEASSGCRVDVAYPPIATINWSLIERRMIWWSSDSRTVYALAPERGDRVLHLLAIDAESGAARTILTERGDSYVEAQPWLGGQPNVRILEEQKKVIWYSERDGHAHLYLYDLQTGEVLNQITAGRWSVRELLHVDASDGSMLFTACGREPERDPYYRHLYRISLDGSGIRLLTPEDADHQVIVPSIRVLVAPEGIAPEIDQHSVSPDGRWVVDCYSRVDMPPRAVLRSTTTEVVREVASTDMSTLLEQGWRWPEPFTTTARDGSTPLYGVLFRPPNYDPDKCYPVIDVIYPGPHTFRVPKSSFGGEPNAMFMYQSAIALTELGFIVFAIDGLGTAGRSKRFHDYSYGNLGDAGGLQDHVRALQQLKSRYPELDLERVGIWGYSAGGFAAARAILEFPEFYKVAVASAGNHDSRAYHAGWGERYHGHPAQTSYESQVTARLAKNLKGKLMLTYGELDDNAHPCMTLQLAAALIEENKDFDLVALPGRNHAYGAMDPYYIRRSWDFFVRHLLGAEPPPGYRLAPLAPFFMEA